MRSESQRALAPYPLKHLEQHGHVNPATVATFKQFMAQLEQYLPRVHGVNRPDPLGDSIVYKDFVLDFDNFLYEYIQRAITNNDSDPPSLYGVVPPAPVARISQRYWGNYELPETIRRYREEYDSLNERWREYNQDIQAALDEIARLQPAVHAILRETPSPPVDYDLSSDTREFQHNQRLDAAEEKVFSLNDKPCTIYQWFFAAERQARRHFPSWYQDFLHSRDADDQRLVYYVQWRDPANGKLQRMSREFGAVGVERDLSYLLNELAHQLVVAPPMVATGQPQDVLEKPRPFSDVEAEIANALANLPQFHARCKLSGSAGSFETTIITEPFAPQLDGQVAQRIVEQSRGAYGVVRREVEEALERRLKPSSASGIMASTRHGEQAEDHEPDNDPDNWDTGQEGESGSPPTGARR